MRNHELMEGTESKNRTRVTVTIIEVPFRPGRSLADAEDLCGAVVRWNVGEGVALTPAERTRPVRDALRCWSPFRPFTGIFANYRLAREALGRSGRLGIVYVCIAAGLASIVWRHATIPIGIGGGLLVAGILFVRTGAYREYLAAIEDARGLPPLDVVLRYNGDYLLRRVRALWQR